MATTSFNAVRKGVIAKLKQSFPNIERVYGEEIAQGFKEPCFFVKLFPASQKRIVGYRHQRFHAFDVHYFTDEQYPNDALHEMAEQLYGVLEHITVNGDLLAGAKMEHEISEGVLHFFIHFDMTVYQEKPVIPLMEELSVNIKIRGDGE